jgi:hypothetical protein
VQTTAIQGLFWARHYPDYVDQMLKWLRSEQANLSPGDRGTAFYFLGIAAFASHDYQTATFFFDAAASEDFEVPNTDSQPAHLFMRLDSSNPKQAGLEIVKLIVGKLDQTIADYTRRPGAKSISDITVRKHFLQPQMRNRKKYRRTLITTFISFLAEWDYRLQTLELNTGGSKEPFFTHLFRGCLLFESLLKNSKEPPPTNKRPTLGSFLAAKNFRERLGIGTIVTSCDDFGMLVRSLACRQPYNAQRRHGTRSGIISFGRHNHLTEGTTIFWRAISRRLACTQLRACMSHGHHEPMPRVLDAGHSIVGTRASDLQRPFA